MFEDIVGNKKTSIEYGIWTLYAGNEEGFGIEVYDITIKDNKPVEGSIRNNTLVIDNYTSYALKIHENSLILVVIIKRIDKNTLRFYIPTAK